ncbi:hypothetical protein K9U40_21665 [Xanthobacter autotrophicus]|uniref:hypothetical protein n=1 Tax=Xanthobacter TaxID=279 RepID=UPI0024AC3E49|nr:hypothetical protein [Xanthobacter autotrophicus]MDI4666908.1 hypothetical protein [Xanthobacter autotrophicus]
MFVLPAVLPLVFLACLLAPARALESGAPSPAEPWPDTAAMRRAAQDFIDELNRTLLAQPSATLTLERWCGARGIGDPALVRAERERAGEDPAPQEVRALLGADAQTPVRHRRVRLTCGAIVLSEADNYYRPDRLTDEMNAILDTTDTPFGKVVRPLDFRRRTLEARLLWRPAEEAPSSGTLEVPRFVLAHRAVLTLPDGTPFSALIERYTSGVLAFPAPK